MLPVADDNIPQSSTTPRASPHNKHGAPVARSRVSVRLLCTLCALTTDYALVTLGPCNSLWTLSTLLTFYSLCTLIAD